METRHALGHAFLSIVVLVVLLSLGADSATPKPTLKATLKLTLKATPKITLKTTPKITLKTTPSKKITLKATPSKKATPKVTLKITPKTTPKRSPSARPIDLATFYFAYLQTFFVVPSVPPSVFPLPAGTVIFFRLPDSTWVGSIYFGGLSSKPTSLQIRSGFPGVNGPLAISSVSLVGAGTTYNGTMIFSLTPAQLSELSSSHLYITVCTTKYPLGEIRGQLVHLDQTFVTPVGINGLPDVQSLATGVGVGVLIGNTFTVGGYFVENYPSVDLLSASLQFGDAIVATLPLGSFSLLSIQYTIGYMVPTSTQLNFFQLPWLQGGFFKLGLSTKAVHNIISGNLIPFLTVIGPLSTHSFHAKAQALLHAHKDMISTHVLLEAK